jgi:hypothetical protein
LLAFIILFGNSAKAQDIILLTNGDEIKSFVQEIYPEYVTYKNFNDQAGQVIYEVSTVKIYMIKYANGSSEIFNEISQPKSQKEESTNTVSDLNNAYSDRPKKEPPVISYNSTTFTVTDIEDAYIMQKINVTVSELLTEINRAFFENKTPLLYKINSISEEGKSDILAMWENNPFRCIETEIIERGLHTTSGGFQVRNIPVYLKDMPDKDAIQEIAINFDDLGNIEGIYFTLDLHQYKTIMLGDKNEITNLRHRQTILSFVENFRTAYNRKDINLIEKVYSEDALIIIGKVVKRSSKTDNVLNSSGFEKEVIDYLVQTKQEYLRKLNTIFKNNERVNIVFDTLDLMQHPKYENIYGVTLKQKWNSSRYNDVGWLFLMIDFKDGENMEIHVRTWQPEIVNGKALTEDEIYQLWDFKIR